MNYKKYKRIFVVVVDSLGVGAMSDSHLYGDNDVNTLGHIYEAMPNIKIPTLQQLGILHLDDPNFKGIGYRSKLNELSAGKDTLTGHWEMMGLKVDTPFQTFTENGFPDDLIQGLSEKCGRKIIGNKAASGTEILDELAHEEIEHGHLIVYTSSDSVLQICGNEEIMGLDTLYRYCEIARELTMKDEWKVGRVIARPYTGMKKGEYVRTSNRHDYAIKPHGKTVLNTLRDNGYDCIGIGKINDIFVGEGISETNKSESSVHGMEQTLEYTKKNFTGICFTNLVDFDSKWGHRRDAIGYGKELERFDEKLAQLLHSLNEDDLLIISADHGNDPTYSGSDHTREKVPFLAYSPSMKESGMLEEGNSFANVGATIADNFNVALPKIGESYFNQLK